MSRTASCQEITLAEHLLNEFVVSADIGLAIFDRELRYEAINPWLAATHGVPAKQHLGKRLREIIGDIATAVEPALTQTLTTGRPVLNLKVQGTLPANPQRKRWISNFFPVKDHVGRVKGVAEIVTEIVDSNTTKKGTHSEDEQLMPDVMNVELLRSWKEIAAYVGTCSKTVQRWERGYKLPVHRVIAAKGAVVFSLKSEIDDWLRRQSARKSMKRGDAR